MGRFRRDATGGHPGPVLGVECGGTRTVGLAVAFSGECDVRVEAGPANLRLLSDRQLVAHFRALARRLPLGVAVGIGMAGVREESDRLRVRQAADRAWPGVPCWAGNDLESAWAASDVPGEMMARTRVIVIGGTGSCCYGRNRSGRVAMEGGWGHILGDKGSAYDVGLSALKAVIEEGDRKGIWPALGARLLGHLQLNEPNDLVTWLHEADKSDVAGLAVEVCGAAASGDGLARRVVEAAALRLAEDAVACAGRLSRVGRPVDFVFAGGLLHKQAGFAQRVARELRRRWPGAATRLLPREGAWGAAAQARLCLVECTGAPAGVFCSATAETGRKRGPARRMPAASGAVGVAIPAATGLSPTEQRNPRSMDLDRLGVGSAIRLMLAEDAAIPAAVGAEAGAIARAVGLIVRAFRSGGRLFYVGAGTSGRLGVLDATECPPTFGTAPDQVQAIVAGGRTALWTAVEGGEDDAEAGAKALQYRGTRRGDVVVGIAASGRTPFVWGALDRARAVGAKTVLVSFNPHLRFARLMRPDVVIAPDVGPEVLTGSTRLKAGTGTKLVLNLLTTLAMVRLGKVKSNLMVDVKATNTKLRARAARIVSALGGVDEAGALAALEASSWEVRAALGRLSRSRPERKQVRTLNRWESVESVQSVARWISVLPLKR